jgi:hypothetical protein
VSRRKRRPLSPGDRLKFATLGRCSGIPECCVQFFIATYFDRPGSEAPDDADYLRCPACRAAGVKVPVRECPSYGCPCARTTDPGRGHWRSPRPVQLTLPGILAV